MYKGFTAKRKNEFDQRYGNVIDEFWLNKNGFRFRSFENGLWKCGLYSVNAIHVSMHQNEQNHFSTW